MRGSEKIGADAIHGNIPYPDCATIDYVYEKPGPYSSPFPVGVKWRGKLTHPAVIRLDDLRLLDFPVKFSHYLYPEYGYSTAVFYRTDVRRWIPIPFYRFKAWFNMQMLMLKARIIRTGFVWGLGHWDPSKRTEWRDLWTKRKY